MFNITLYRWNKRKNSTAKPDSSVFRKTFNCYMVTPSSIINPVIRIDDVGDTLVSWTYAYIPYWDRYYFINDYAIDDGRILELTLECDVLASFKDSITSSSQYVLRSSSSYDGRIVDDFYPTLNYPSITVNAVTTTVTGTGISYPSYFTKGFNSGTFVVGVIGNNDTGVSYYAMSYSNFKSMLTNLMNYTPSDMTDVSNGIAKALANPIQYITGVNWFPSVPSGILYTSQTIHFGYYGVTVTCGLIPNSSPVEHLHTSVSVTKHPQASTRGTFLNLAPFSRYVLLMNPFGLLEVDANRIGSASSLDLDWYSDCITGSAELFVTAGSELVAHCLCEHYAVPIPISQITVDTMGSVLSSFGAIGSMISLDIGGMFANIGNASRSASPVVSSKGSMGSMLSYNGKAPCLYCQFMRIVDEDLANIGRPLCQKVTLSTLSGFAKCGNSAITIDEALGDEIERIVSYMDTGFFIE